MVYESEVKVVPVWFVIKRIGGWFLGPIGKYATMALAALGAVAAIRKSGADAADAEHEIAGLQAQVRANELEGDAEDEAERKSDADLIKSNSLGV